MRLGAALVFLLSASCGPGGTKVAVTYCGVDLPSVRRVELELSRATGFSELPSELPDGVTARIDASKLVYDIGPDAPGFPEYVFRFDATTEVTLTGRAFSDTRWIGQSAGRSIGPSDPMVELAIAGEMRRPDCSVCTEGNCQLCQGECQ